MTACRVLCASRVMFGMSLAMDMRCATYSVTVSRYTSHIFAFVGVLIK